MKEQKSRKKHRAGKKAENSEADLFAKLVVDEDRGGVGGVLSEEVTHISESSFSRNGVVEVGPLGVCSNCVVVS